MSVRLSVKIMAHPRRERFIPELVERLGVDADDVVWDTDNNRWHTGRRAWEAIDQSADWGLVIQDDAIVCRDLIAGLEAALATLPPRCIATAYIGTRRPVARRVDIAVREARERGAAWIRMPSLNWGVAIILPTDMIDGMLPWCDRQHYPNYDRRIGRYAIDRLNYPTYCTYPSLVDHRETQSLVGHGDGRVAHDFIGEDASALDINWNAGVVDFTGRWSQRRGGGVRTSASVRRDPKQAMRAPKPAPGISQATALWTTDSG